MSDEHGNCEIESQKPPGKPEVYSFIVRGESYPAGLTMIWLTPLHRMSISRLRVLRRSGIALRRA